MDKLILGLTIIIIAIESFLGFILYKMIKTTSSIFVLSIFILLSILIILICSIRNYFSLKKTKQTLAKLKTKNKVINSQYSLLRYLSSTKTAKDIEYEVLCAAVSCTKNAEYGSFMIHENGKLHFSCAYGYDLSKLHIGNFDIKDIAIYKLTNGLVDRPVIIKDISLYNKSGAKKLKSKEILKTAHVSVVSTLSFPIYVNKNLYGILNLDTSKNNGFDEEDKKNIELFILDIQNFISITELRLSKDYALVHDSLTDLYNRSYLNKSVDNFIAQDRKLVLVSLDLDNLKITNDTLGHSAGDLLIKTFAYRTKKLFAEFNINNAIIARTGGDEFTIAIPDSDSNNCLLLLEKVRKRLKDSQIHFKNKTLSIRFSYGLAEYPTETDNIAKLYKMADSRMYQNKKARKERGITESFIRISSNEYSELKSKNNIMFSLYKLSNLVHNATNIQDFYDKILLSAINAFEHAEYGSLLVARDNNKLFYASVYGFDSSIKDNFEYNLEKSTIYKETNGLLDRAVIINNILETTNYITKKNQATKIHSIIDESIRSTISVAIHSNNELFAVLYLDSSKENAFNSQDIKHLEFFSSELSNILDFHY